jgi:hypothetical protein
MSCEDDYSVNRISLSSVNIAHHLSDGRVEVFELIWWLGYVTEALVYMSRVLVSPIEFRAKIVQLVNMFEIRTQQRVIFNVDQMSGFISSESLKKNSLQANFTWMKLSGYSGVVILRKVM